MRTQSWKNFGLVRRWAILCRLKDVVKAFSMDHLFQTEGYDYLAIVPMSPKGLAEGIF